MNDQPRHQSASDRWEIVRYYFDTSPRDVQIQHAGDALHAELVGVIKEREQALESAQAHLDDFESERDRHAYSIYEREGIIRELREQAVASDARGDYYYELSQSLSAERDYALDGQRRAHAELDRERQRSDDAFRLVGRAALGDPKEIGD
jgi:hypothetical protein